MAPSSRQPVRVLHVVNRMHHGGVENWLMHVLRQADRKRVEVDFLVHSDVPGVFDAEIASLGCRLLRCSLAPRATYAPRLLRVLRASGPYDVVHSHVHHFSGVVLSIAALAGVPIRIAHSHSDKTREEALGTASRKLYLRTMKCCVRYAATAGLAVSDQAGVSLFGTTWKRDPRWHLLYCGVDLAPFRTRVAKKTVRAAMGLPADAPVFAHVGRFSPPKNHSFLLRIAAEIFRCDASAYVVLVGDGPLREQVLGQARAMGLPNRLVFLGLRNDIPRLLQAVDAVLLPSLFEGLPLVGIEAQAAAVPLVLSDAITREVQVIDKLVHWHSLADPPTAWATTALSVIHTQRPSAESALAIMERSPFSLSRSAAALNRLYGV